MDALLNGIIPFSIGIHIILIIYVQLRARDLRNGRLLISLSFFLSLLATLVYLMPEASTLSPKLGRGSVAAVILALLVVVFGMMVAADTQLTLRKVSTRLWLTVGIIWLAGLLLILITSNTVSIGEDNWLIDAFKVPTLPSWIMLGGLGVSSLILLGISLYAYSSAPLPEIANRALYWVIDIAVILLGVMLMLSATSVFIVVGIAVLFFGLCGALYAQVFYQVFDIRSAMNFAFRTILLVSFTTLVAFFALFVGSGIKDANPIERNVLLAILAIGVAIAFIPIRRLTEWLINPILKDDVANATSITRRYSQLVTQAVELEALLKVVSETLNDVLKVRRSGLMLVNDSGGEGEAIQIMIMPGSGFAEVKDKRAHLSKTSPAYRQLADARLPLSQFDLEFSPKYKNLPEAERQFFKSLHMSAYAPIGIENALIGILAVGPKNNDAAFFPRDLDILSTLAYQTGVALRNARLVADLRHLNKSITRLNKDLEDANQQMEKLDSVKTDFITIASHELRTPLAQIRGYTDILDAVNEQGMLDQAQTSGMVGNLRKATERMEELIAAMLDVSQLDVNAMDLRFAQTTPESVVRMAIEPLTDAIRQRKLTLSARGLRGLPLIDADLQRLVQAFRNIVVNAIKFTPDGGRIEITASLMQATQPEDNDQILIAIADTGVGINKENLELIFEKFYRTSDPSLHSTGTYKFMGAGPGLGLTIARGVIEGHGGKIWAESPGHNGDTFPGSTFYVTLPLKPPADATRRVMAFEGHTAEKTAQA